MTESVPQPEPQGGPRPGGQGGPRPQVSTGERPMFLGQDVGPADGQCWVVSKVDGLHIREYPSKNSRSDGHLDAGQSLPASCYARRGDYYGDCGGSEWWIPVPYEGRTDHVAWACVDWYTSGDGGDEGPGFRQG
jgi:hypothetical protein